MLSHRYRYIIPNVLFYELVSREDEQSARSQLNKLHRIVRLNTDRMFIGRNWEEIDWRERSIWSAIHENDLVDHVNTRRIRKRSHTLSAQEWTSGLLELRRDPVRVEHERVKRFVGTFCQTMSSSMKAAVPQEIASLTNDPLTQRTIVQSPDLIYPLIRRDRGKDRYRNPYWERALRVFPDQFAWPRVMRMVFWYSMLHSFQDGASAKWIENNWDDLHYGFLASYTGLLYTKDKGMIRMLDNVFGVRVVIKS